MITVSVAYVGASGTAFIKALRLTAGSTIAQAIEVSGIFEVVGDELNDFRHWLTTTAPDTTPNHKAWFVGVFSVKKPLNTELQDGDRVEIYRPLTADPMKQRKIKSKRK